MSNPVADGSLELGLQHVGPVSDELRAIAQVRAEAGLVNRQPQSTAESYAPPAYPAEPSV